MSAQVMRPLGAVPVDDERVEFRVWAPAAQRVEVRVARRATARSRRRATAVHAGVVDAHDGDDYLFVLDRGAALPDPCSRFQPDGVKGPSRVVDTSRFRIAPGPQLPLEELVLYELHVGTFTPAGTFDAVIPHLARLRSLGVTAIELMPVATFPGLRGWGYDGVYAFAPHPAYGGPDGAGTARRRRASRGPRRRPRRRLQPHRPGVRGDRRVRPVLHRPPSHVLGSGDRLSRSEVCASGRSRTRSCGRATIGWTACGSTRCTRSTTTVAAARPA